MYLSVGRTHVRLNFEPLEEVDCFSTILAWQLAMGGSCERYVVHRMNEAYKAWVVLKSVLRNRGLGINMKKCLCEGLKCWLKQRYGV